jgi:abortive infection bacteriophage resistance protein
MFLSLTRLNFFKFSAFFRNANNSAHKNRYSLNNNLGAIMFWQLYDDKFRGGLLDVII